MAASAIGEKIRGLFGMGDLSTEDRRSTRASLVRKGLSDLGSASGSSLAKSLKGKFSGETPGIIDTASGTLELKKQERQERQDVDVARKQRQQVLDAILAGKNKSGEVKSMVADLNTPAQSSLSPGVFSIDPQFQKKQG